MAWPSGFDVQNARNAKQKYKLETTIDELNAGDGSVGL